jgi:hypothetical protein
MLNFKYASAQFCVLLTSIAVYYEIDRTEECQHHSRFGPIPSSRGGSFIHARLCPRKYVLTSLNNLDIVRLLPSERLLEIGCLRSPTIQRPFPKSFHPQVVPCVPVKLRQMDLLWCLGDTELLGAEVPSPDTTAVNVPILVTHVSGCTSRTCCQHLAINYELTV